jgi:hypothetical protein
MDPINGAGFKRQRILERVGWSSGVVGLGFYLYRDEVLAGPEATLDATSIVGINRHRLPFYRLK